MADSNIDGLIQSPTGRKYPQQFFDPLTFSVPTLKIALQWARRLYRTDPLIHGTIRKMATYPITDLVVQADNDALKRRVEKIVETLHLRKFLMNCGIDFFCYGNSFVSIFSPAKRYVTCDACGKREDILSKEKVSWRKDKLVTKCKQCDMPQEHSITDIPIRNVHDIKLIRWAAEYMEIKYNPITGNYMYIYNFPLRTKKDLISNDVFFAQDTPIEFIMAAQKDQRIILNTNKIFHMRRESLGDDISFWGEPMSFPLLREIYYFYVNKKAQEILAHERIIPLRVIFPSNPGGVSPDLTISLGNWKSKLEDAMQKWARDPNYMPIMPFPVGYQSVGGEATRITLWPELNASQSRILLGLGVPPEFLVSGTWTGSSISVRMVENLLLNYRTEQEELISFLLGQILPMEGIDSSKVMVKFSNFKMADDIQYKQLMFQLNQNEKLSDQTLLSELGRDLEDEIDQMKQDLKKRAELAVAQAKIAADTISEQMKGQARGQAEAQKMLGRMQSGVGLEGLEGMFLPDVVKSMILQLQLMKPPEQQQVLSQMASQMPTLYEIVNKYMQPQGPPGPGQQQAKKPSPLPETKPPQGKNKTV